MLQYHHERLCSENPDDRDGSTVPVGEWQLRGGANIFMPMAGLRQAICKYERSHCASSSHSEWWG